MFLKIHKSFNKCFVSLCDKGLIGKRFEEKDFVLDVTEFYKGELKSKDEIISVLKEGYDVIFIGEKAVSLGLELKLILKKNVKKIQGVPYAQTVYL